VAWYEEPSDDGAVIVHAGFEIGEQAMDDDDNVRVVALPPIEVASTIDNGSMDGIETTDEAVVSWVEQSGFRPVGRNRALYHHFESERFGHRTPDADRTLTNVRDDTSVGAHVLTR